MSKEINTCIHCGRGNKFEFYLNREDSRADDTGFRKQKYILSCIKCNFQRVFTNLVPGNLQVGMITTEQLIDFWNEYNNDKKYYEKQINELERQKNILNDEIQKYRWKVMDIEMKERREKNDRI